MLSRWVKEAQEDESEAFRGNGKRSVEQEELHRLRDENRRLRMEREILKNPPRTASVPHLSALSQAVALYDTYQRHVSECDQHIEALLAQLRAPEPPDDPLPSPRHQTRQPNALNFDVRAAVNVGKTDSALGAFYRRLAARVGKAKAVTATARKLAILFYNTLRYGIDYSDPGASYYEERHRARVVHNLERRARQFGFTLEAAPMAGVS